MNDFERELRHGQLIEIGMKSLAEVDHAIGTILKFKKDFPKGTLYIANNYQIAEAIERLCSSQARAFGCLFDDGKRHGEPELLKKLRLERVKRVKDRCKEIPVTNLANKGVRNALAHFDERFLKSVSLTPKASTISWLAASNRGVFTPDEVDGVIVYLGIYFFDSDELCLFDEVLHLEGLRREIEQIVSAFNYKIDPRSRPDLAPFVGKESREH